MAPRDPSKTFVDAVFAIGSITLNYGKLENAFRDLFCLGTGMTSRQGYALFHRIQNDVRLAILDDLLPDRGLPDEGVQLTLHFMRAYNICVDNRNALMHSFDLGQTYDRPGINLVKYTKAGSAIRFPAPVSDLADLSDAMERFAIFGDVLCEDIRERIVLGRFLPLSWPGTLPMPRKMDWLPH
jgi:hypothetical protein